MGASRNFILVLLLTLVVPGGGTACQAAAQPEELVICFTHVGESDKPMPAFCLSRRPVPLERGYRLVLLPPGQVREIFLLITAAPQATEEASSRFGTFQVTATASGESHQYFLAAPAMRPVLARLAAAIPPENAVDREFVTALRRRLGE